MSKLNYLNVGCGNKFHKEWINVDMVSNSPHVKAYNLLGSSPILMENGVKWVAWRSSKHHPSLPYYLLCKA